MVTSDKIIIGAGLYGLYAALRCASRGERVIVLECENAAFLRATYINQARVHMGYHYPRSLSTALKSKGYFERFCKDFSCCINKDFRQVYATSSAFSWTSAERFRSFCRAAGIRCDSLSPDAYFKPGMCDGAFETTEYTYDAAVLKDYLLDKLSEYSNAKLLYSHRVTAIEKTQSTYVLTVENGEQFESPFVLNATYAGVNQILTMAGFEPLGIKYELCEIILCRTNEGLKDTGITVMDGPFFSVMPFGKTGLHSLTSVAFTPHHTCYEALPKFDCQKQSGGYCSPNHLGNCNECTTRPKSSWNYMSGLARKYLSDSLKFTYEKSLFSMKPILKASELDDSRPTVIRQYSEAPYFYGVLSGKINTVYDLDVILDGEE